MNELIAYYGDIKRNTYFSQLINITQKDNVVEHINRYHKLSLEVKKIPEDNLFDLFMGVLK